MICFDIETGPLPDDVLFSRVPPFEPPPHPSEFDPAIVKYGNTKDPVKREQKLAESYQAHQLAVANHELICEQARVEWESKIRGDAALSPFTGRILAIGAKRDDCETCKIIDAEKDEAAALEAFWSLYRRCRESGKSMVGCYIKTFDVPFMMWRSWILGVSVPSTVVERGRFIDSLTFVDLADLGRMLNGKFVGLDVMAKAFGLPGKVEGIDGSQFATLWASNRQSAIEYLTADLNATEGVAIRVGVV
jgi:hypothetical protein